MVFLSVVKSKDDKTSTAPIVAASRPVATQSRGGLEDHGNWADASNHAQAVAAPQPVATQSRDGLEDHGSKAEVAAILNKT